MPVEVFTMEDVAAGQAEHTDEDKERYAQLVAECGLEGQQGLLLPTGEVIPYLKMDARLQACVFALCPFQSTAAAYTGTQIPLRVLEVIALCRQREWFEHLLVRSASPEIQDPVLIGRAGSEYSGDAWLLARWGEDLFPWNELRDRARDALRSTWKKAKVKAEAALRTFDIESSLDTALDGDYLYLPW